MIYSYYKYTSMFPSSSVPKKYDGTDGVMDSMSEIRNTGISY